jgi:hypothetical protein
MVNLYIVNPAHKLYPGQSYWGSNAFWGMMLRPLQLPTAKGHVLDLIKTDLSPVPRGGLTRNTKYERDESGGLLCLKIPC